LIEIDLPMQPIGQLVLIGRVIQLPSRSPLPDATVLMRDQCLTKDRTIVTDAEGLFKIPVSPECIYNFNAKHEDYIDARKEVSTKGIEPPGEISVLLELGKVPSEPILLSNIYYDMDKYFIRRDAAPDLEKLAVIMNRYTDMEIELSSHTDSRATDEYNLTLSQNRAESALEYLVDRGIQRDRMVARGYGEKQLRNNCADGVNCSERDHQRNRRTEFRILNFGQDIRSTEKSFIPVNTGQIAGLFSESQLAQIERELKEVDLTKEAPDRLRNPSEYQTDPVVTSSQQNQTDQGEEVWFQSGVAYSVHLGSGSLADASGFNKYRRYGAVQYEPWEGQYLYVLGYFTNKAKADQVLKEVISGGLADAYLVIYKNGVRTN
jgi:outer membrane protein OmpA-like peptidoglycan-associated protein